MKIGDKLERRVAGKEVISEVKEGNIQVRNWNYKIEKYQNFGYVDKIDFRNLNVVKFGTDLRIGGEIIFYCNDLELEMGNCPSGGSVTAKKSGEKEEDYLICVGQLSYGLRGIYDLAKPLEE